MKSVNIQEVGASNLKDEVAAVIRRHSMLKGGEKVLVGLSGGPDSVCLLYLLNKLRDEFSLTLHAVYVNHNLRPDETPREIEFCKDLCRSFGIDLFVKSIDVKAYIKAHGLNKQEAARELRYRVFDETAFEAGADRVALAHNADDQAETLLMRLLRGSGPTGLSGIPVKRGKIIRPLIGIERVAVEKLLDSENIPFVVDSSNLRTDYFRNKVRNHLMPVLKQFNPNLNSTLLNTISILRDEESYFDIIVTKTLMKLISRKTEKRIELFLAPMEVMETVILRRVLRRAIAETRGLRGLGFAHMENIIDLVKKGRSGGRLYIPKGVRVIKGYSLLVITSEKPVRISDYELQPPGRLVIREAGMVIDASFEEKAEEPGDGRSSILLDGGMMNFPLKVRHRMPGDFFYPMGFGKRKKLQDFFVDEKAPRDERDGIPLILSGDDIIWIAGYRADERYKITQYTKKFLRLAILKGNFQ